MERKQYCLTQRELQKFREVFDQPNSHEKNMEIERLWSEVAADRGFQRWSILPEGSETGAFTALPVEVVTVEQVAEKVSTFHERMDALSKKMDELEEHIKASKFDIFGFKRTRGYKAENPQIDESDTRPPTHST